MIYRILFKRLFDLIFSLVLLIISSPIIILTSIILLLFNKGQLFFFQTRPGLNHKPFVIFKFKTMKDRFDTKGIPLPDEERITVIGKIIRSLSIDELLQLFNVLKGDMSLVGPRPLLSKYLPLYSEEQKKRHNVKPGITGLAQVNGRNNLTWEEKFKLDVFYSENISFILDLKIIIKTIFHVFKRTGINSNGKSSTEEFKGNNLHF